MKKEHDPLGKRALFSVAKIEPDEPPPGPLDVDVECSSCHFTTRMSAPALLVQHFPIGAWIPGRDYPHFMRCPRCLRFAWVRVSRAH